MHPWLTDDPFRVGTYGIMAFICFMVAYALSIQELKRRRDFLHALKPTGIPAVTRTAARCMWTPG